MKKQIVFPPRLSMDAYADHFEQTLKSIDPIKRMKQKMLEERIERPFCLVVNPINPKHDDTKSARGSGTE